MAELTDEQERRALHLAYECQSAEEEDELLTQVEVPEELDLFVELYNWDCGRTRMRKVLDHSLCDRGTALKLYWRNDAAFFADHLSRYDEVPEMNRDVYEFHLQIEKRLLAHDFASNQIRFEPFAELDPSYHEIVRTSKVIPEALKVSNLATDEHG